MNPSAQMSCRFGPLVIHYDERVLTPRPWTLKQSEWAVEICATAEPGPILELCAGAGQIGLAAAVLADRDLVQVEADGVAAGYARSNAARAGWAERTDVRHARLETAVQPEEQFAVIVADPPYLRSAETSQWPQDPTSAIDGGLDGLDLVVACLDVSARHLAPTGRLVLQIAGPAQDEQITDLLVATPDWGLTRLDARVVDDARAIMVIGASSKDQGPPAEPSSATIPATQPPRPRSIVRTRRA